MLRTYQTLYPGIFWGWVGWVEFDRVGLVCAEVFFAITTIISQKGDTMWKANTDHRQSTISVDGYGLSKKNKINEKNETQQQKSPPRTGSLLTNIQYRHILQDGIERKKTKNAETTRDSRLDMSETVQ